MKTNFTKAIGRRMWVSPHARDAYSQLEPKKFYAGMVPVLVIPLDQESVEKVHDAIADAIDSVDCFQHGDSPSSDEQASAVMAAIGLIPSAPRPRTKAKGRKL